MARPPSRLLGTGTRSITVFAAGKLAGCGASSGSASRRRTAAGALSLYRCDDCARPSACRWGVKKNGGHAAQALGRSRGGLSTKIHAGCIDEHTGVALVLTAGHGHESPVFATVLAQVPRSPRLTHAIMERRMIAITSAPNSSAQEIVPVIPPKSNRTEPLDYDKTSTSYARRWNGSLTASSNFAVLPRGMRN